MLLLLLLFVGSYFAVVLAVVLEVVLVRPLLLESPRSLILELPNEV